MSKMNEKAGEINAAPAETMTADTNSTHTDALEQAAAASVTRDSADASTEPMASVAACTSNTSTCETAGDRLRPECDGAAEARDIVCDVVIVGCGVAGLYCALNLPSSLSVVMLAKTAVDECDSMLAQGGICVQHDDADYAPFFEDTLRAGHYENRCESVDLMIRASRSIISDLVKRGVDFERDQAGSLRYTREGAHSRPRICFHSDITGDEITSTLLARVRELPNVRILEHTCMDDILIAQYVAQVNAGMATKDDVTAQGEANVATQNATEAEAQGVATQNAATPATPCDGESRQPQTRCCGVLAHTADGAQLRIFAGQTLWACGGIGGMYPRSTNFPSLTGDACAIAARHDIALEHMDYVQIHPTSLYSTRPGRAFLISESCRGEGAVLLGADGERFTDELQPRDVVSAAIYRQMTAEGSEFVRLSFANMPKEEITGHFKNIYRRCLEEGFDITREPIPVVPAQHYFMGGVRVDRNSATDMPGLYAAGETSCNGVHGKNRLASNSLLESLVFAQRAAWDMCRKLGVKAPVAQTYPEQPCGADAQAYEHLCAEAERKTRENAAKCGPQNTTKTCAQNVGQSAAQTELQNAGQTNPQKGSQACGQAATQTCPQNPSPSDIDRTASSKEVVCA